MKIGESWYRTLLRSAEATRREHPIVTEPLMVDVYAGYLNSVQKPRRPEIEKRWSPIADYWRTKRVADINAKTFREFFGWRRRRTKAIGPHTQHKDLVLVRQVLNYGIEEELLDRLPPIPSPGRIQTNPRPWLTRMEWEHLIATSNERIKHAPNERTRRQRQDLDDFLMVMIESMMRVEEVRSLTAGQCRIVPEQTGRPEYVRIDVRGKTGHRTVIAGGLASYVVEVRSKGLKPTDRLWPYGQRDAFRELLVAAHLRTDEFGHVRNLKSIRATAISLRILSQAPTPDLLTIARNAGTSSSDHGRTSCIGGIRRRSSSVRRAARTAVSVFGTRADRRRFELTAE